MMIRREDDGLYRQGSKSEYLPTCPKLWDPLLAALGSDFQKWSTTSEPQHRRLFFKADPVASFWGNLFLLGESVSLRLTRRKGLL